MNPPCHPYDCGMQVDWMCSTQTVLRALADEFDFVDAAEMMPLVRRSLAQIEAAPDRLQAELLRLMLVDLCGRMVHAIHSRNDVACSCLGASWELLPMVTGSENEPRSAFAGWAERFLDHVLAVHPLTAVQRAACLIRSHPSKAWTLHELAASVDSHEARLSRQFRRVFGLKPTAYLHLVRMSRTVLLLRTTAKVEAIASEVGYRSKKDFYAALKRWVGLTPTEVRRLGEDELDWLVRELRRRTLGSADNHGTRSARPIKGAPSGSMSGSMLPSARR
jgi:AraC-like DNA-binding protein